MRILLASAALFVLTACGPNPAPSKPVAASPAPAKTPAPAPKAQAADPRAGDLDKINKAAFDPNTAATLPAVTPPGAAGQGKDAKAAASGKTASADAKTAAKTPDPVLMHTEALLARARFSPGVVDGLQGTNLQHALSAYQSAHALNATGQLDADTWRALSTDPASAKPVAIDYTITAADIAGPFAPDVGEDFVKLAAQPDGPQFATALEALAERFHMSQALLQALNPGVDFKTAGAVIVVIDDAAPDFQKGDVARIEVSKADAQALAYDKDGKVIAFYPATVGSTEKPSPTGTHKVNGVARNPDYTYDPAKLNWGPRSHGKLTVKPGPNNPVGVVWIDLNAPSYGIHGSPDPEKIGKTASHGCVRLTNWDAMALAAGVKPGVTVTFEGERGVKGKS